MKESFPVLAARWAPDNVAASPRPLMPMGNVREAELPRATIKEDARMKCVFSVDVEDWFHILDVPSAPQISEWDALPSVVEPSFMKLLDILSAQGARVTCFFLGWVGRKCPHLVLEAKRRGHEIASHGFAHRLVYQMTPQEFLEDARKSKTVLEDIAGTAVEGYRSAGFSVKEETPWFFDKLMEAGYRYDSSVFPAPRGHGGLETNGFSPYVISNHERTLIEFPMTVERVLGRPVCFFGGGYLRLFPYAVVRSMVRRVLRSGRPVIFYVHPREVDPGHPRLSMGYWRTFKTYVNLKTTEGKVRRLTSEFEMTSFQALIRENPGAFGN